MMVKSFYIEKNNSENFEFFITEFKKYINNFHLASNYNKYNLILTDELEEDIENLYNILVANKKNPRFNFEKNLKIYCTSIEQFEFMKKYKFNSFMINEDILRKINQEYVQHEPEIVEKPHWAFNRYFLFLDYYRDENIHIMMLEGFESHWEILPLFKNNQKLFVTWPCKFSKWNYEFSKNTIFTLNKNLNAKNIVFLSPNLDGILWSDEYGFDSILCNQNCWLDFNRFKIENKERIFDMVMNCRPEITYKRPYLAKSVNNLAYIKGYIFNDWDKYDYTELNAKYVNENYLSEDDVNKIYNQSVCGGIFSPSEGACYSSSEYLLCGLPVISTNSLGGRDFWYDDENSVIVEPNENKIKIEVEKLVEKHKNGLINYEKIRNKHIMLSLEQRKNFIDYIQKVFDENNININSEDYFNTKYIHKMKHYLKIDEVIKILK